MAGSNIRGTCRGQAVVWSGWHRLDLDLWDSMRLRTVACEHAGSGIIHAADMSSAEGCERDCAAPFVSCLGPLHGRAAPFILNIAPAGFTRVQLVSDICPHNLDLVRMQLYIYIFLYLNMSVTGADRSSGILHDEKMCNTAWDVKGWQVPWLYD